MNANQIIVLLTAVSLASLLHGCSGRQPDTATATTRHSSPHKGRTQLWQENCNGCHNARSSRYYSDEQWDIAMHHMRVRGYLTAHETREILEFLQSAN